MERQWTRRRKIACLRDAAVGGRQRKKLELETELSMGSRFQEAGEDRGDSSHEGAKEVTTIMETKTDAALR